MKANFTLLAGIAIFFITISCQKEISGILDNSQMPPPPHTDSTPVQHPKDPFPDEFITTSFQGRVLDESGLPLQGALVVSGQKTAMTDKYGIFRIMDVAASKQFAYVKVMKVGYLTGSRTVIAESAGFQFVQVKLLRKTLKGGFDNASGGLINIAPNAQVRFQTNAVVTESGQTYSGKVLVYGTMYDPTTDDFADIMPGGLRGLNADSQAVVLRSYGMINVQLETETGEKLQLDHKKPATFSLKVPESLLLSAPKEIPLWHFSESDGKWREEGRAVLNSGIYSGEVSHFSTWNCDMPMDFVSVSLRVTGLKGRVLPYTHVRLTETRNKSHSDVFTDSTGYLITAAPKGIPLVVEILNDCNGVLFSQSIAPLNADVDLGTLYGGSLRTVNISGQVVDCNGQPATSGKATIFNQGLYYTTDIINGEYYISMTNCETSFSDTYLYVSDTTGHYVSEKRPLQITGPNVDGGAFTICDLQLSEYTHFTLGSDTVDIQIPSNGLVRYDEVTNDNSIQIYARQGILDLGNWNEVTVEFYDTVPHVATVSNPLSIRIMNEEYVADGPMTVEVKEFGKVGEEIYLTFSGVYKKYSSQTPLPLNGEMRVIRTH